MQGIFRILRAATLSASIAAAICACGGGAGGGGAVGGTEMTTISGHALKGPIQGGVVRIYRLKGDGTRDELLGTGTTGSAGSYAVQVPKGKAVAPLLVTVSGQGGASYRSETTGNHVEFTAAESFSAVLDSYQPERKYTVGPLTEAAYQQLQKFLTDNPALSAEPRIVGAANAKIAALFNITDVLADPATDASYMASLKIIDRMVENAKGSGAVGTSQTMALLNQAFADVAKQPYQSYRSALVSAAEGVKAADPSSAAVVNAILAAAADPAAEPDWTDATAPEPVTTVLARPGAETSSTASVLLSWSAAATTGKNRVAGYEVYRDGTKIASVSTTTCLDGPLALTTGYRYRIVSFDAAGNRSAASSEVSATTPDAPNLTVNVGGGLSSDVTALPFKDITPPSVPTGLVAAASAIDAVTSSVQLTWNAATDAVAVTGYEIFRDGVRIGSASQATYTDSAVRSGRSYSYSVTARDAAGNRSAASAPLSVTPVAPTLGISIGGQVST